MEYTGSFNGKNKKLPSKSIVSYKTLVDGLRKAFKNIPEQPALYYFDEGDDQQITLESEDDFQTLIEPPRKTKIFIRGNSADDSQILNQPIPQVIQPPATKPNTKQVIRPVEKEGNSKKTKQKVKESNPKKDEKLQKQVAKQEDKTNQKEPKNEPKKQQVKVKKVEVKKKNEFTHQQIVCKNCTKTPIVGVRYKCLNCAQYDLCGVCRSKGSHKHHKMAEIENDGFWRRLNYTRSIRMIFNPNYEEKDEGRIDDWTTQEDILQGKPHFVNEVWSSSESLISQIVADFDSIEKDFQATRVK